MIASGRIEAVRIGAVARLDGAGRAGKGLSTAFAKMPASGPVAVGPMGLAGDSQGNLRLHGGLDKAVYAYPVSGYAGWRAEFPELAMRPGAMGENLVVAEMDEHSVHIGDIVRIGSALLQVSQIREPCSTLAAIHGTARVVRAMTRSGRCGWYLRVLENGVIAAGDAHAIIDRPNPGWPVARFAAFAAGRSGTIEALAELATLPGLTPAWQAKAAAALALQGG
jgi:MOSC domain-containing protein YiiM